MGLLRVRRRMSGVLPTLVLMLVAMIAARLLVPFRNGVTADALLAVTVIPAVIAAWIVYVRVSLRRWEAERRAAPRRRCGERLRAGG